MDWRRRPPGPDEKGNIEVARGSDVLPSQAGVQGLNAAPLKDRVMLREIQFLSFPMFYSYLESYTGPPPGCEHFSTAYFITMP